MRVIHNTSTDAAFNLATEEWLLRNTDEDIFMLWRNAKAVIVGRNQNSAAEIDEAYIRENGIQVIRRLTGGGAVFHDQGNVNFTFIQLKQTTRQIDFQRFTTPILEALQAMGVNCSFTGRNDLVIDDCKFSGNAQLIEKDRVLHHGTLLYSAEMADLSGALKVNPVKYVDKAVKSIRKRVTNISSHLPEPVSVEQFIDRVMRHVAGVVPPSALGLHPEEIAAINELVRTRYSSWEWNFGASPRYTFSLATRTVGGVVEVHLNVEHGRITAARIFGDFFGVLPVLELEALLQGCRHDREDILGALEGVQIGDYIRDVDRDTFLDCLF